jgi:hypothetical protein
MYVGSAYIGWQIGGIGLGVPGGEMMISIRDAICGGTVGNGITDLRTRNTL